MSDERRERGQGQIPGDVLLVLRIVHAALVASILLFLGVVTLVTRPPADPVVSVDTPVRAEPPPVVAMAMIAAGGISLVALLLVRRRMARARDAARGSTDPQAGKRALARYYTGSIVSWALAESIALCGFILAIIHREPSRMYPFAAVGVVLMVVLMPRRRDLESVPPSDHGG